METQGTQAYRLTLNEIDSRYEGKNDVVSVVVNESRFQREITAYLRENPDESREQAKDALLLIEYWLPYAGKGDGVSIIPLAVLEARGRLKENPAPPGGWQ